LLTGYVHDLTTITPKVLKECAKELSLPGEIKNKKVREVKPKGKQTGRFRKKAILYTCLLLLLIPLLYPPVSTTLKTYFVSVVNFYDQLFEQFAGPAHSRNAEGYELIQAEKQAAESSALNEEQSNVESREATRDISEELQPLESRLESVPGPVENAIDLKDFKLVIPFDYNSNEVPESAYGDLNRAAAAALQDPNFMIVVKGYTDDKGSSSYNRQLSQFRANIVKSYLVGQGVSPKRIKAIGMGEESPLEPNMTETGRRANRRVEIQLIAESS
jgi:general secretion pathway protein A